ncbi:MAG TPA: hypothetical protein VJL81_02875 [Solirubrobacterales bacterium]|nr:hypothetical protein [Solirubrobacterales bacterium]
MRIEIRPAALKSLPKLSRKDRERISSAIGQLPDGDFKRLRGPTACGDSASASGASSSISE